MQDSTRIVQISDIHLFAEKTNKLLGVPTYESLTAVVELLGQERKQPDAILISGDMSQDHSEAAYRHMSAIFKNITVPIYCFPGNHDNVNIMRQFFPHRNFTMEKNIVFGNWQLILLNSQKVGAVEGWLSDDELIFMENCLREKPTLHAIVAFHHHPVLVGSRWLDNLGLKNADALWSILKKYPQVKTVLFGHVHQEYVGEKNGIPIYSAPSTCIQFKPKVDDFSLDYQPPGFRWIDFKSDGTLRTEVVRCADYVGTFEADAKGY